MEIQSKNHQNSDYIYASFTENISLISSAWEGLIYEGFVDSISAVLFNQNQPFISNVEERQLSLGWQNLTVEVISYQLQLFLLTGEYFSRAAVTLSRLSLRKTASRPADRLLIGCS